MLNNGTNYPNKRNNRQQGITTSQKNSVSLQQKNLGIGCFKCYDWAIEQRESGNCVISGFHSQIEKDVFHYLAKGNQPIILALPRGLKKRWEPELNKLLKTERFLVITPFDKSITRITSKTAEIRNRLMLNLADEIIIGYKNPSGTISKLLTQIEPEKDLYFLQE